MNRSILAVAALLAVAGSAFAGAQIAATIALPTGETHTLEADADENGDASATVDGAPVESLLPAAPAPLPATPELPAAPELPPVPVVPGAPTIPGAPELPTVPGAPSVPELPADPSALPAVPEAPALPSDPLDPTVPALPVEPGAPETPTVPELPAEPTTPAAPEPTTPDVDQIVNDANEIADDLVREIKNLSPL